MSHPLPTVPEMLHIAAGALAAGNVPFAEIVSRMVLDMHPDNRPAQHLIRQIAQQLGLDQPYAPQDHPDRYLLIKAWGYGFWSDMDHVLGCLLLAEMTGRVPVVHWGANSLFSDDPTRNAFENFFEPVSNADINTLASRSFSFFPGKWSADNLRTDELNKWAGADSRVGGIQLLNRTQNVLVADFYIPIIGLVPWIRPEHPLYGRSIEQIYRLLFQKYLRPVAQVQARIDSFYEQHLHAGEFIGVHVRGSDKQSEMPELHRINATYFFHIDQECADPSWRIFLLTDAQPIIGAFGQRYQDRLVLTACERTDDATGLHYKPSGHKSLRGVEVMVDTYLAARARRFIGNGASNVSCMVQHLKDWRDEDFQLLVPSIHHQRDPLLHQE
jgi:hypothetical protein